MNCRYKEEIILFDLFYLKYLAQLLQILEQYGNINVYYLHLKLNPGIANTHVLLQKLQIFPE